MAQAPAGQVAAGRAALRPTVAIAMTPDLGAAQTLTPPISGQALRRKSANLPATAGIHEVQVRLFVNFRTTFENLSSLLASHHRAVNSVAEGLTVHFSASVCRQTFWAGSIITAPHFGKSLLINYQLFIQ